MPIYHATTVSASYLSLISYSTNFESAGQASCQTPSARNTSGNHRLITLTNTCC